MLENFIHELPNSPWYIQWLATGLVLVAAWIIGTIVSPPWRISVWLEAETKKASGQARYYNALADRVEVQAEERKKKKILTDALEATERKP